MENPELFIYLVAASAYFVPFYIGLYRKVNGLQLLFWLNLLLGWTFVAWVLMIFAAFSLKSQKHSKTSLIA
jgi:hypothetical protein